MEKKDEGTQMVNHSKRRKKLVVHGLEESLVFQLLDCDVAYAIGDK